jgi:hypothetical protein
LTSINPTSPHHPRSTELDLLIGDPGWTRLGSSELHPTAARAITRPTQNYLSNPTLSNFDECCLGPPVVMLLPIAKKHSHWAAGQTMEGLKWTPIKLA